MAELKELAEFYARAAAMKDPVLKLNGKPYDHISPNTDSIMKRWTVEERQPDFQCLIDSGIDCEFSNDFKHWYIGKLSDISSDKLYPFISDIADIGRIWSTCRPRLNHPHAWIATEDSKCPVPYDCNIEVYRNDRSIGVNYTAGSIDWSSIATPIVTAFKIRNFNDSGE